MSGRPSAATEQALKLVQKGMPAFAAARKAGIAPSTIYRALASRRTGLVDPKDLQALRAAIGQGLALGSAPVAIELGVQVGAVAGQHHHPGAFVEDLREPAVIWLRHLVAIPLSCADHAFLPRLGQVGRVAVVQRLGLVVLAEDLQGWAAFDHDAFQPLGEGLDGRRIVAPVFRRVSGLRLPLARKPVLVPLAESEPKPMNERTTVRRACSSASWWAR
jgi:hypothetical protein